MIFVPGLQNKRDTWQREIVQSLCTHQHVHILLHAKGRRPGEGFQEEYAFSWGK